jgi:hypothetical protein
MKFKGTIVITDPLYILPDIDDEGLWSKCDYGNHMQVFGIENYITKPACDWTYTTFKTEYPKEVLNDICDVMDTYFEVSREEYCESVDELRGKYKNAVKRVGIFRTESGYISVFLLDNILKFNPNYLKQLKKYGHCTTTIKDFDGEIEFYINKDYSNAHIIGKGNINFFTIQTGL